MAQSLEELWRRSTIVVEGVVAGDGRPVDYQVGSVTMVMTMYDIDVLTVYKASSFVASAGTSIQVRRLGGERDRGDHIEATVQADYPLFNRGERYILFLRQQEWSDKVPYSGVYHNGTTSGSDSAYQVVDGRLSTHANTAFARGIQAGGGDGLRNRLLSLAAGKGR